MYFIKGTTIQDNDIYWVYIMPPFSLTMTLEDSLSFLFYTDEEGSPERLSHLSKVTQQDWCLSLNLLNPKALNELIVQQTHFLAGWQGPGAPRGGGRAD